MSAPSTAEPSRSRRRVVRAAVIIVSIVALVVLAGFFAVPPIAQAKLQSLLSEALGRRTTIGKVEFNPFTLKAKLHDLAVENREGGGTLFAFDALDVDLSAASLRHRAPVIEALRLVHPRLALVRNGNGGYNIDDLIDRMLEPGADAPPARFSVNNIEMSDGEVSLDDRARGRKDTLGKLELAIPFLSSLPYDAEIHVTPRLAGSVNGSPFALQGDASSPFAATKQATIELNLDALPLARYVEFSPRPLGLTLSDGALTTRLRIAFVTAEGSPRTLTVDGDARVEALKLARRDGSMLASAGVLGVKLRKLDVLGRVLALAHVRLERPEVELRRLPDGTLEPVALLGLGAGAGTSSSPAPSRGKPQEQAAPPPAPAGPTAEPAPSTVAAPASGWTIELDEGAVVAGRLRLSDRSVTPAFEATLSDLAARVAHVTNRAGAPSEATLEFTSDDGARLQGSASVDLVAATARGHVDVKAFSLTRLFPYYAQALNLEVRRGTLDCAGDFDVGFAGDPLQVRLHDARAALDALELGVRGERDPAWRVPRAELSGIDFDLAKQVVAIGSVEIRQARAQIVRERDGGFNFARLVRTSAGTGAATAAASPPDQTWNVTVAKGLLDQATLDVEDRVPAVPVKLRATALRAAVQDYSNARGTRTKLDLRARLGEAGRLALAGAFATNPPGAQLRIEAQSIALGPLRPYIEAQTNVIVTAGALSAKGRLAFDAREGAALQASYAGDITIADFASLDRPTAQDLLRWKTLALTSMEARADPFKLAIGAIALDGFYARLIVNPDATLNLQKLAQTAPAAEGGRSAGGAAPPAASPPAAAPAAGKGPTATATAAPPKPGSDASGAALPVSIGSIAMSNGNVQFSDLFVKPNYSANLTDVAGRISTLSPTQAGDIELEARVDRTAPVQISGRVNPFVRPLTLDLVGKAHDIDLPPLTPYSEKYAGYGIEKGKLSFDVRYRIDDRKLSAENKVVLDQLTFGERVESPTATKLPVLLAVALLKDRRGVIDLELPVSGSLDDPQFSVGRLIVQVIVNLITKVVTSPFALLGALAQGGEQLAYVEFAPGRSELPPAAEDKLRALSKALNDRPALKLDASGRAIPAIDAEGLKRAALDRALQAQKRKAVAGAGDDDGKDAAAAVTAEEYPRYLAAVYKATDLPGKPRNVIGMAKDIPVAEMEALLMASYPAGEGELRSLANGRSQAVKAWLVEKGGVPSDRIFVLAPHLDPGGVKEGAATRVDFSLK